MFILIASLYRQGKLTPYEVWAKVDSGKITEGQATVICGPRPKKEDTDERH